MNLIVFAYEWINFWVRLDASDNLINSIREIGSNVITPFNQKIINI